jgi:hypothetical protein
MLRCTAALSLLTAVSCVVVSSDRVSMNRSPDGSTGSFALHDTLSSSASSPGKRVNGSAF